MAGNGRHPTLRLDRMPLDKAAREVADRIYRLRGRCKVFLLPTTGIVVRRACEAKGYTRGQFVGEYDKLTRPSLILDGLRQARRRRVPRVRQLIGFAL